MKSSLPAFLSVLVAVAALTAGCSAKPAVSLPAVKDVTAQAAFALIQENKTNPDFFILDVRTPAEFAEGHLQGAISVDLNAPDFQKQVGRLDRNKTYLVYCRTGVRSRQAVDIMQKLDFRNLYNLLAGITPWAEAGYPTVK